jgi:selT/selW/selH-like putative selenoprotein
VSALELRPGDGGRFEVFVDDAQIYSKLATGEFPEWPALRDQIAALASA